MHRGYSMNILKHIITLEVLSQPEREWDGVGWRDAKDRQARARGKKKRN